MSPSRCDGTAVESFMRMPKMRSHQYHAMSRERATYRPGMRGGKPFLEGMSAHQRSCTQVWLLDRLVLWVSRAIGSLFS